MPSTLRAACSIRVVSKRIKRSFVQHGIPETKIKVLPIKPELDVFLRVVRTRMSDDRCVVLTASRLATEKDIPRLMRAFEEMHRQCPHAELRIVGEGREKERLQTLVRALDIEKYVQFIPWTEHIEIEMVNADIFALASMHEAYGLVLVEALATGTPVVTTDVGCVGEVVKDDVHGLVVKEAGTASYAAALIRMCTDASFRARAREAGRQLGHELAEVSSDTYAKEWVAAHTVC